ncbi:hypothetical protein BC829DRAFT_401479 [Chytridium lagenaria]|nr:hypothetical protein BC829DRAFT_401479 [Chytridium lagenaria]
MTVFRLANGDDEESSWADMDAAPASTSPTAAGMTTTMEQLVIAAETDAMTMKQKEEKDGDDDGMGMVVVRAGESENALTKTNKEDMSVGMSQRETTSTVLRGLNFLVNTAKTVSDVSFAAAKFSTSLGIGIARSISENLDATGIVSGPLSAVLNLAELIAISSIDLGKFWTGFGLHTAASCLRTVDHVAGDTETARAVEEFAKLVHAEVNRRAVEGDGEAKSLMEVGFLGTLRAVVALVCLQKMTREEWKRRGLKECGPVLRTVRSLGDSDPLTGGSGEGTAMGPDVPANFAELSIGQFGEPSTALVKVGGEGEDSEQCRWREMRRYIRFATGAYGRHITQFLRGENPIPGMVDSRKDPYGSPPRLLAGGMDEERLDGDGGDVHPERRFYADHTKTRLPDVVHSTYHGRKSNNILDDLLSGKRRSSGEFVRETPVDQQYQQREEESYDDIFTRPQTLRYHPTFFLVLDHPNRSIVVALRGTLSFHDLMVDLTCSYQDVEFEGKTERVHAGMYRAAMSIALPSEGVVRQGGVFSGGGPPPPRVFEAVKECMSRYPAYQLVITGHSLGADVKTGRVSNTCGLLATGVEAPRFHCYAFASPAVVTDGLSRGLKGIVTSGGVRDVAGAVVYSSGVGGLYVTGGGVTGADEDEELRLLASPTELRELLEVKCYDNEKLLPGGRVLWTGMEPEEKEEKGTEVGKEVEGDPQKAFGEIEVGLRMLTDHMPNVYEEVMHRAAVASSS